MTFAMRVCAWVIVAAVAVAAWHWITATESTQGVTQLAVRQFQNTDAVPERLQQATLAQNWWPLAWPLFLALAGGVLFWDEIERWWRAARERA